ncbi:hypothetical protein [Sorangium sp. So ce590]|uniref:hypothetical protein n=1 Tax=unclassified Sorangium TaxID=2621164 RepID=UPI003F5D7EF3
MIALGDASAVGFGVGIGMTVASNRANSEARGQQGEIFAAGGGRLASPSFAARCAELQSAGERAGRLGDIALGSYIASGVLATAALTYALWPTGQTEASTAVLVLPEPRGDGVSFVMVGVSLRRAADKGTGVYACAEMFEEAVELPVGVKLFCGLDCANGWGWIGETTKTIVAPGEEAIALKVMRGEGTARVEDVSVRAADAQAAGASSNAVLVDGAEAELVRCELIAGNGADGAEGENAPSEVPAQAAPGNAGTNACSDLDTSGAPDETLPGGAQVESACGLRADGGQRRQGRRRRRASAGRNRRSRRYTGVGGSKNACAGGQGGQGGNGGPGGGGLGGPSLAIAYRGGEAGRTDDADPGTAGTGGPGGSANVLENTGAEGTAATEQAFP